jgi:chemotaxis protein methyltransferase CheR
VTEEGRGVTTDDFEIIATDISPKVLSKAISGSYNDMEIKRGLSDARRNKFFKKEGDVWVIDGALRSMVDFKRINLAEPFTRLGGVDVIFCRNVLIYFNEETKHKICAQFHQMLSENGYLILGAMENAGQIHGNFTRVTHNNSVIHQRNGR